MLIAMKKYKLLILPLVALALTSCTKEYVTKEYITEQTIIQGMDMDLIDFQVKSQNWQVWEVEYGNPDEGYFEAVLEVPEITKEIVEKGVVHVYRKYSDQDTPVYTPLPAMRTEKTAEGLYYTTFVDYEWKQGYVSIFVTASDLYAGEKPGDMDFRVAVML